MKRIKPMKASTYVAEEVEFGNGLFAEPKMDGHRHIVRVLADGSMEAWSSGCKDSLHKMDDDLRNEVSRWAPGVYDGELHLGYGHTSSEVAKLVNRKHLIFEAFDLIAFGYQRLPYSMRRSALVQMAKQGERATFTSVMTVKNDKEVERFTRREWERGGEGLIIKFPNGRYIPGMRSKAFLKVKASRVTIVTIERFKPPKVGALFEHGVVYVIDSHGNRTSVRVLNHVERENCIDLHATNQLIGSRIQIEYQSLINGSYRHPRWDHWVEDV